MKNKELVPHFPDNLRLLKQWVVWKLEERDGKKTKVPYQPNGQHAASNSSATWSHLHECMAVADQFDGVGFVFTEGVVGIDLDKCFEDDGTLKPFAREALDLFDSYTEISPSGNGLHLLVESATPVAGRKKGGVECYSSGRFFTVTGNVFEGRDTLREHDVTEWYERVFPADTSPTLAVQTGNVTLPEDGKILNVMFTSKNGQKMRVLYNIGDWQGQGYGSQSEADLALAGALMFFCCNDTATVDRLFRGSKLMRPKWDEKRGVNTYGQETLTLARKSEVMMWGEDKTEGKPIEYLMSNGKIPVELVVLENICRVFDNCAEMSSIFRLNDFTHMIESCHDGEWSNLQEDDVLAVQRFISVNYPPFAKAPKELIVDAIRCSAKQNKVNPPVDYLRSLVWDEVPRLDFWLHLTYGVPNDELHEKIGANWLKGLVKRVLYPGCQFDEVLVLEGAQGWRKSSSLRVLGAPWHVESTLSTEDKDFYMLLARSVIFEFSEGEIVGRTSARKLKAIITKTEDSYRPPYERGMVTFKRGCVFAMTTNDGDYQKDETGGRRWLPVVLRKVADVDWLAANRDQLYAEAVYRVEKFNETSYEYPQDELQELQNSKGEHDEIEEPITRWFESLPDEVVDKGILAIDAFNGAVNSKEVAMLEIPREMTWRITRVFRATLKLENVAKRVRGRLVKRWFIGNRER